MPNNPTKDEMQRFIFGSVEDIPKSTNLPVKSQPKRGLKPGSKAALRVLEAANRIAKQEEIRRTYSHSAFCQIGLPYRRLDPTERTWKRRNGNVLMEVSAGRAYDDRIGDFVEVEIPWGPKVRLVQIYLDSMAVQSQNRRIETGPSLTNFVTNKLKLTDDGRTIASVKAALGQFAAATWRFGIGIEGRSVTLTTSMVRSFEVLAPKGDRQQVLFPNHVEYSQDYLDSLLEHAVPLLDDAVAGLSHNAMALDIYRWLAQRLHRQDPERPTMLTWNVLHEQFGWNYERLDHFRPVFLGTLQEVLAVYPAAKGKVFPDGDNGVCKDGCGLWLCHAAPPILKRQTTVLALPGSSE